MIQVRKSKDRGHANHGWLDSFHSFSFADYYDPKYMGFRALRVINEDIIAGERGFATHGHRDMEILTVVLQGALEHEDSLGNKAQILPGEVQQMSAGTGVQHSEKNPGQETTHLLQIWILPDRSGYPPSYGQKSFTKNLEQSNFVLAASGTGRNGTLSMHQDADLYLGSPKRTESIQHALRPQRHAWIQVIEGSLQANGSLLEAGDGAAVSDEEALLLVAQTDTQFLLFDLP